MWQPMRQAQWQVQLQPVLVIELLWALSAPLEALREPRCRQDAAWLQCRLMAICLCLLILIASCRLA